MTRTGTSAEAPAHESQARSGSPAVLSARAHVVDALAFLESADLDRSVTEYQEGSAIYRQGGRADRVYYLRAGSVKLSVASKTGREAVIAMLRPGDFFGEACLARTLLLLAHYGSQGVGPATLVPKLSQETLAEMVGTTRSRVNLFLNKFKKLGFIDYDGRHPISVNNSLLTVVLRD